MSQSALHPLSPPPRYAGLPLRLFAGIIDLLVLAVPLSVFISFLSVAMKISTAFLQLRPGEAPSAVLQAFGKTFIFVSLWFFILLSWLYFALLESSPWRATLGKRALSIYVTDLHADRVSFGRATARFFFGRFLAHIPVLGIYYFMIDCLSIPFTQRKQAIHDIPSGCLVLRETSRGWLAGPGE